MLTNLRFVFLGLSITSSWGNGHATTYRALVKALARRGHDVLFLERDVPWYARHRDLTRLPGAQIALYSSLRHLRRCYSDEVRRADIVVVGSFVPEGRAVGNWARKTAGGVLAFYDIDTPVTLAALEADRCEYLSRAQLNRYDLYLSFTGGPVLTRLARLGARAVRPLYCAVDPQQHRPLQVGRSWDLGYLGTYAEDRQQPLERFMFDVARRWRDGRFAVAGPQYPPDVAWPANVDHIDHVAPDEHSRFYAQQRFTLNLTREDMRRVGYSPSVRLFEAAACGAAIMTDDWEGLEEFFEPDREILRVRSAADVEACLREWPEADRVRMGERARHRVLTSHTAAHRAASLEAYAQEFVGRTLPSSTGVPVRGRSAALPLDADEDSGRLKGDLIA